MCDRAGKVAKRQECSFVFDKLLTLEAQYPVTNFAATDGSKDIDAETGAIRVGRACLAVELGALGCSALGGQLDVYADTFERHSYEAELAAFHDYLAATENTVTVVQSKFRHLSEAAGRDGMPSSLRGTGRRRSPDPCHCNLLGLKTPSAGAWRMGLAPPFPAAFLRTVLAQLVKLSLAR